MWQLDWEINEIDQNLDFESNHFFNFMPNFWNIWRLIKVLHYLWLPLTQRLYNLTWSIISLRQLQIRSVKIFLELDWHYVILPFQEEKAKFRSHFFAFFQLSIFFFLATLEIKVRKITPIPIKIRRRLFNSEFSKMNLQLAKGAFKFGYH